MVTLDSSQLMLWVGQFFWPLVRLLALFSTAPIFSEHSVSKKVKIGLAVMITGYWRQHYRRLMLRCFPSAVLAVDSTTVDWHCVRLHHAVRLCGGAHGG